MNNPFVMTTTKKKTLPCCDCGISTSINDEVFFNLFDNCCCSFLGLGVSTISISLLFADEEKDDADFDISCQHPTAGGSNNFAADPVDPVDDYDDDDDDFAKDYYITTTTMMEDESLTIVDDPLDGDPHRYDNNNYNGNGYGNSGNGKNDEEVTKKTNTTGILLSILLNRNCNDNCNDNNNNSNSNNNNSGDEEDTTTTNTTGSTSSSILLLETIMMKDEESITQQDDDDDDDEDDEDDDDETDEETFSKTSNTLASAWTSKLPSSLDDTKTTQVCDELEDILGKRRKGRKSDQKSLLLVSAVARDFLLLDEYNSINNNNLADGIPSLVDANNGNNNDDDDPSIVTFNSIEEGIPFLVGDNEDVDDVDDNNKVGHNKLPAAKDNVLMINITKSLDITATTTICTTDEEQYCYQYDDSIHNNYNNYSSNNVPFDEPQSNSNNSVSPATGHACIGTSYKC